MAEVERDQLDKLVGMAQEADAPKIDVSDILGIGHPLYIGTTDLHDVLLEHDPPGLRFTWDENTTLEVQHTDGGVLATFSVTF